MLLAYPQHPVISRSGKKSWNLWYGRCVSSWRHWFWSLHSICYLRNWDKLFLRYVYTPVVVVSIDGVLVDMMLLSILSCLDSNVCLNCIIQDSQYHNMDKGSVWHFALVSCISSPSIGLPFMCALSLSWVSFCIPFTNSLIEFYFIMIVVLWPFF